MVKYLPRYLITTTKLAVKIEPIKYLEKYMPICLFHVQENHFTCGKIAFYNLHKYFSGKIIHKSLEKVCIFDSSTAKPETPLMDFLY